MRNKLKTNRGITLIALVITIIVLLILAGVTIAALSGENGILNRAVEAKQKTEKGDVTDRITMLLAELQMEKHTGTQTMQKFLEENFDSLVDNGDGTYTVTLDGYEAKINQDGDIIGEIQNKYKIDHSEVVVPTITPTGKLANNPNVAEVREGKIPIPTGFTYIKGDKIGGAVITDGTSEFVWVPVDTPSEMYGTEYTAKGNVVKRWGKLYNFTSATANESLNWTEEDGKISITATSGDNSYREPDVLPSSSYDDKPEHLTAMNNI